MFEDFKFERFAAKLDKVLDKNIGYYSEFLKEYDIDNIPLTQEMITDIPTMTIFDKKVFFFYKEKNWNIFIGISIPSEGFVKIVGPYWLESLSNPNNEQEKNVFIADKPIMASIPGYIRKKILVKILENKSTYVNILNNMVTSIRRKKFGDIDAITNKRVK